MMKKRNGKGLWVAAALLAAFLAWTALVCLADVQAIGPLGSSVGLATLNGWVHGLTGVHMTLYTVTDWLGLVPIGVALSFAVCGLVQWIRRRSLRRVDGDILALGGFYVAVIAVFLLFEVVAVNHRPVLIEGVLEVSYPSSTTLLVTCVMPTAAMVWGTRMRGKLLRGCVTAVVVGFTVFMVIGRLVAGVHWVTDIIGGVLLSGALVTAYGWTARAVMRRE